VIRNTLGLKVSEIPNFTTEPQVEAIPIFKDNNITVFSIPIVPTPHFGSGSSAEPGVLSNLDMLENVLKQKHKSSSELPLKHPILDLTVPTTDGLSTSTTSPSLLGCFLVIPSSTPPL
jgi:hypothetical protein